MDLLKKPFRNSQLKFKFENIIEKNIQSAGIWFVNKRCQLHWFAKISILCFLGTNTTQILALVMAKDDPKKLYACLSVFTFCVMGILKLWSLIVYLELWHSLITQSSLLESKELNSVGVNYEYESDDEENIDLSVFMDSYMKKFVNISTHLSRMYCFTLVMFMSSPFFEYGLYVYNETKPRDYPHILPGLAPLDSCIYSYLVTVIAEAISAVYCVIVHKAFDLTAIGLLIFISGQFSLLQDLCERIGGKGKKCVCSKKRNDRAHYRIKNCHYIHISLLKLVNELGKLLRNILGIYFVVASLTLCSVAVQLQEENLSAAQILSLVQYLSGILTQLFLFCYYGDAMFNQSLVGLGEGPFCAAIWCLGMKARREIAILSVGMTQPCRIFAGPFNTLDFPSFIKVVRAAYSIYAVLRQTSK